MPSAADEIYQRLVGGGQAPASYVDPVNPQTASGAERTYQRNLGRLTDDRAIQDLQSLTLTAKARAELPAVPTKAAIGSQTGIGVASTTPRTSAGIASPLTEADSGDRTYHAIQQLVSTDGLIVVEYQPINSVAMTDANGAAVQLVFDAP